MIRLERYPYYTTFATHLQIIKANKQIHSKP